MELDRSSGILLHLTSLSSPFGIGDMGPEAYKFVDFLKLSGHTYWQLLPLNPTDEAYSHSPYSSDSAFAGNRFLISPELLEEEGYIKLKDFDSPKNATGRKVDFEGAVAYKEEVLEAAYKTFSSKKKKQEGFQEFCKKHDFWLEEYSLFKVLHKVYGGPWTVWPKGIKDRKKADLKKASKDLADQIEKIKFVQFLFFSQWEKLSDYAHQNGIRLFGDIPFYVNHDSADCWANSEYFKLNEELEPEKISGVPPDYFSETGQLWGTPVYDWKKLKANDYDWWVKRIKQNLLLFDLVRLDHFRAFAAYWEVPAGEETAENGKWVKTPGINFFRAIKKEFPDMPLIAEDLGLLDEPVYKLMAKYEFPGMNVLQFAFGGDKKDNPYLPFNHLPQSIVYTGTHDNNTTKAWFKAADKSAKKHLRKYTGEHVTKKDAHKILHEMAWASVAKIAIVPLQDILGLGKKGLMNIPGSTKGNWSWRLKPEQLPGKKKAKKLKKLNKIYGRLPAKPVEEVKKEEKGADKTKAKKN